MGKGEPGWYYAGKGQLRYKDGMGWTDHYKDVDKVSATQPMSNQPSYPASATVPPNARKPGRRRSTLVAVCVGLLGVGLGAGRLNADAPHGLGSWASGQVSAFTAQPASPTHA